MPQQPIANIKALTLLHFSLFIGQLMFAGIAGYLVYTKIFETIIQDEELALAIGSGSIGVSVMLVIQGFSYFKKKVQFIKDGETAIPEKLSAYRATSIIRWAMLEAPTLLMIICFLLTGKYSLLIVSAVLLPIFFYTKPTTFKVAQDLGIREEEVL